MGRVHCNGELLLIRVTVCSRDWDIIDIVNVDVKVSGNRDDNEDMIRSV